jgi:DNA mismatch endonuclease, patch repair protein
MSRNRKTGARSTEKRMRSFLARHSIRGWKMNDRTLFGVPDFVFHKAGVAVFIDGCFWHQCPSCGRPPKSNLGYWSEKLRRNKKRDKLVTATLRRSGWLVMRFWEHEVANTAPTIAAKLSSLTRF